MSKTYAQFTGSTIDYSDWYAVAEEMVYDARFCYRKSLSLLLAEFRQWIVDNDERIRLMPDELAELDGLIHSVVSLNQLPLASFEGIPPVIRPIIDWMNAYMKSVVRGCTGR